MTRRRSVAKAAAVIPTSGSKTEPSVKWSEKATVEKPRSSMRRTSSSHFEGGDTSSGREAMKRKGRGMWWAPVGAGGASGGGGDHFDVKVAGHICPDRESDAGDGGRDAHIG